MISPFPTHEKLVEYTALQELQGIGNGLIDVSELISN